MPQPKRPTHLPPYSQQCLEALATKNLGHLISLGGAFGLLHYLDYRSTHDVDAWWMTDTSLEERQQVILTIEETLATFGELKTRQWGDVVSIEVYQSGQKAFSFQIASRSAQLELSQSAPWTDVLLDSLTDLVASKMVALVERGTPRDFRDIYAVCQAGLVSVALCWEVWHKRQTRAGLPADFDRAHLAIQTHLARIARHRPLEKIDDPQQKADAEKLRDWFRQEFLTHA